MSDLVSIIHVHEASTHIQTDALRAAQQGLHHQLLVLPPGGLLVELGAGCDIHRLNALSAYAQQRGGGFVAHDIVPEVARLTEFDLENVPYVSGPPHSQFLGSLLRAAEAPLVVCLKNVLTATAQTALDELTETIRMTNPLRLVVTQTVSMAEASDVYPAGLSPGLNYGENRLLQYLPGPGETAPAEERLQYQLHAHHAGLAYTMSALEVAIDHLRSRLRAEGLFTHARGLAVKTTEIRHGESAKEFITLMTKGRGLPFENLNSVVIGPFGIRWSTDKKLPPGALRINWFEVHWVFDNQGRLDIQPAENQTVEMFEGAIPAIPSAMTHYTDAESDAFGRIKSHGRLRFSSATNFQLLRETGAAKGVELLFQLGEATSHPLITAARARGYDAALRAAFSRQRP